jgi:large subunit ribosomal protein L30
MSKMIKVKLSRSPIGAKPNHRKTVKGLGLTKLNQVRLVVDTDATRGMVKQVCHLVDVIEENAS